MVSNQHYLVEIELKRVQTWLFEAPRLKAMVGANTLIGELLYDKLPALALANAAAWPAGVSRESLCGDAHKEAQETAWFKQDPLKDVDRPLNRGDDDAILIRDASRFWVLFQTAENARNFATQSRVKIAQVTGGVTAAIQLVTLTSVAPGKWRRSAAESISEPVEREVPLESPLLEPCGETGHGVAVHRIKVHGETRPAVSASVRDRMQAEDRQVTSRSDRVGLLQKALADVADADGNSVKVEWPEDFTKLAGGGYLAVLCADGNGVGAGRKKALGADDDREDVFAGWLATERYFWGNRAALRGALCEALKALLGAEIQRKKLESEDESKVFPGKIVAPCRVLMLGGDDLLVLCQARYAPQLASDLCAKLKDLQPNLTLGVGVAVVHPKFPFRRAHELAERLLESSKVLHRSPPGNQSCIDWQVLTASHLPNLAEQRRADWLREGPGENETAVLSCRPYTDQALARALQASGLLAGTAGGKVGRGQLRDVVEGLFEPNPVSKAKEWMEKSQALPKEKRKVAALKSALAAVRAPGTPEAGIFRETTSGSNVWLTEILDLVELAEMPRLGTRKEEPVGDAKYDFADGEHTVQDATAGEEAGHV